MAFMPGFEERWQDAAEFVIAASHSIRGEHRLDGRNGPYDAAVVQRTPSGISTGSRAVLRNALAAIAAFPDGQLLAEDVLTAASGEDSFVASQRQFCIATHGGDGIFGPPTGCRIGYRVMADSWCRSNLVQDEWMIEDRGAILRQIGHDVEGWTRGVIACSGGPERFPRPIALDPEGASPLFKADGDDPWGAQLTEVLGTIASGDLAVIQSQYDRAVELALPGGETGHGTTAATGFWAGLLGAFPSATFRVDHAIGAAEPLLPPRAAVRWMLSGRHDGWGRFGRPTGATVHVLGMTHVEFGPRGLRREWTLFDETSVWSQILLASGRV